MPEAKEKQDLKRIVIPMKPADGKGKTWWHRAGIAGRKDCKIWGRITSRTKKEASSAEARYQSTWIFHMLSISPMVAATMAKR